MEFKNNQLIFIPVGGSEEIGMNANLYHYNGNWILVDLGISFPDETHLGVDILLPDFDFIKSLGSKLLGIFITHGHEDHFGAIPYFANQINCPIWGTDFTLALLKRKLKENNINYSFPLNHFSSKNDIKVGEFTLKPINTSHSIPQAVSFLISTSKERVFHTGDWKIEFAKNLNENSYHENLKEITSMDISSIISDSTNSLVKGKTNSEESVSKGLFNIINKKKGCILITCFSSNISRIKSILSISKKINKKVLVIGRSLNRSIDAAKEVGLLDDNNPMISIKDLKKISLKSILIICAGSQGESNSALSRISLGKHDKIKLSNGDTVIFSSRKIPGNENAISKIENRLLQKGIEIINDESENVHVSGHPSEDELIEMYNLLKPNSIIPVHGNIKQLRANSKIAKNCQVNNVLIPKNGNVIKITNKDAILLDQVSLDTKVSDGGEIVSLKDDRFSLRKHALWNGTVTASIVINNDGEVLSVPKLTQKGVSDGEKIKNVLLEISLLIEDYLENILDHNYKNDEQLEYDIGKIIVKEIKKIFLVRPLTTIHINRIQ